MLRDFPFSIYKLFQLIIDVIIFIIMMELTAFVFHMLYLMSFFSFYLYLFQCRNFIFKDIPQIQFKNRTVQITTLRNQSDIPLINVFLGELWVVRMVMGPE